MKKFLKYLLILTLLPTVVLTSCKDDDDDDPAPVVKGTFTDLKNYLVDNNMDIDDVIADWITTAEAIHGKGLDDYYIMDVRTEEYYNTGHIPEYRKYTPVETAICGIDRRYDSNGGMNRARFNNSTRLTTKNMVLPHVEPPADWVPQEAARIGNVPIRHP